MNCNEICITFAALCPLLCIWHHHSYLPARSWHKGTLHPLPTLQNNEPVPQVLKQVVNLSCFSIVGRNKPPLDPYLMPLGYSSLEKKEMEANEIGNLRHLFEKSHILIASNHKNFAADWKPVLVRKQYLWYSNGSPLSSFPMVFCCEHNGGHFVQNIGNPNKMAGILLI